MPVRIAFPLVAVLFTVALAPAVDPKKDDNKEEKKKDTSSLLYSSWAQHKPGTSLTVVVTMKASENGKDLSTTEYTGTIKLLEVTDDKCVIESEGTRKQTGQKDEKVTATKQDVEKKLGGAVSAGFVDIDPKTGKPSEAKGKIVEEKTEKVKVGGTEFECKRYKIEQTGSDGFLKGGGEMTVWMCDDFPGLVVAEKDKFWIGDGKTVLSVTHTTTGFAPGK